jgi:pyrroloquinoline quinone biosynthesis protein B
MRVTVLGSGQDGGLPQAGAAHPFDDEARTGTIRERTGPSLLVEDGAASLLCDVSPDFRLQWWKRTSPPGAIALTHAHIGHYAGLVHFGKEVMAADRIPLHATDSMLRFLGGNAPWKALLDDRVLVPAPDRTWADRQIELFPVPHRGEFSDTVAVSIGGSILWIPDIDDWAAWPDATAVISSHDVAFLDATFWASDELVGRDVSEVPHPLVPDTLERFAGLSTRLVLTHLNHTNPLCDPGSPESAIVHAVGFEIASDGLTLTI